MQTIIEGTVAGKLDMPTEVSRLLLDCHILLTTMPVGEVDCAKYQAMKGNLELLRTKTEKLDNFLLTPRQEKAVSYLKQSIARYEAVSLPKTESSPIVWILGAMLLVICFGYIAMSIWGTL